MVRCAGMYDGGNSINNATYRDEPFYDLGASSKRSHCRGSFPGRDAFYYSRYYSIDSARGFPADLLVAAREDVVRKDNI